MRDFVVTLNFQGCQIRMRGGGGNHIPFADLKQNLKHITFYITNFMRADFKEWISFSYLIEQSD